MHHGEPSQDRGLGALGKPPLPGGDPLLPLGLQVQVLGVDLLPVSQKAGPRGQEDPGGVLEPGNPWGLKARHEGLTAEALQEVGARDQGEDPVEAPHGEEEELGVPHLHRPGVLRGVFRVGPKDGEEGVPVPGGSPVPEHPLEGASRQVGDARGLLPGDGQVYGPDALPRPRVQRGEGMQEKKRNVAHS